VICGSFFSNIGLLDYGLYLAGIEHAWGCEADPWRRAIWERRFRAPCHPDIRELRADAVRPVTLCAGGFPCKGASSAGKREGFDHPETVLWREMARAIGELRPRYVLVENVAAILALHDGAVWGEVLRDLAALGFDVEWDCLPAAAVGAPHLRDRVFAVAHATGQPERDADDETDSIAGSRDARALPDLRVAEPEAVANASGTGREERDRALAGGPEIARSADDAAVAQDANGGAAQSTGREWRGEPQGAPVAVDWAEYGPAIAQWEQVIGRPAGEPLLSGVVARSARGVVRSRLSALGDGVQVQVGYLAGRYIVERERERLAA
jgi:DNA (cytosine-5)-methyltransferase 1